MKVSGYTLFWKESYSSVILSKFDEIIIQIILGFTLNPQEHLTLTPFTRQCFINNFGQYCHPHSFYYHTWVHCEELIPSNHLEIPSQLCVTFKKQLSWEMLSPTMDAYSCGGQQTVTRATIVRLGYTALITGNYKHCSNTFPCLMRRSAETTQYLHSHSRLIQNIPVA